MRLAAAAALAALAAPSAAVACSDRAAPDPRIPPWRTAAGPATPAAIDDYLQAVDRRSARVRTYLAGRSLQGRPIRYAAVGTPANIARLPRLAAEMRGLRRLAYAPPRARRIARTRPAFLWLGASVHGNEPSGGDADLHLLHDLAAGRTCADRRRLARVVVFLLPVQNPDGRAAATRLNAAGFDLNRDWFARTQPETEAKVAALARFPPTVFADQHEEPGTGFFFPPNADPVHHEVPVSALHAIARIIAPALRRAFDARGLRYVNYATYDLFFMGYGDSVPSTLFGAAGMTYEKGSDAAFADRVAEQRLAADRTVRAAAAHRTVLLGDWATEWRRARAQGARGALQPNRVLEPGAHVRFRVPDGPVHGYVFRADLHGADAAALAQRLATVGVRVLRLDAPATASGFRGYGEPAPGAATLPAGTYYVPLAQAAKHWVQALLGEDPYVPFPYFYDVSAWSNPLLMGLRGGLLTAPLAARATPVRPGAAPPAPGPAAAYGFDGGAEGSAELAFELLGQGLAVRRDPAGGFTVTAGEAASAVVAAAARRRVALRPLPQPPAAGTVLARPRVALLQDAGSAAGWARWLLEARYGLSVDPLSGADIGAGRLAGADVLVVPDGASAAGQLPPAALLALQAWVRGGGTLVGARSRGLAVAQAAGLTAVTARPAPPGLQIPGVALRVELDPTDPVAAGEEREGFAFNVADPILEAHGARVAVRYPDAGRFFVSGSASGAEVLEGTPAVTDETVGAGRVILFAFDPVFRGYVEGTERLLGNALLAPAAPGSTRRAAPRLVDPALLEQPAAVRDATIRVAAEDEPGLVAAARAAGVPDGFALERDLTTVTLRVAGAAGLDAARPAWARRLPGALRAAGVVPLLAVL